jgi:dTDP-4-dehydrorhamnose 3,5-epimerase
MIFRETTLAGVHTVLIERRADSRGSFGRVFCRDEFAAQGLPTEFVQASTSVSVHAGTVRGMHYQRPPHAEAKLVRCVRGAIHDVVADVRPDSPSFMRWEAFALREGGDMMLYIPPGFAHGFQTLADETEVLYQMSTPFAPEAAAGFRFDDPAFGIAWPAPVAVIAEKDLAWPPWGR